MGREVGAVDELDDGVVAGRVGLAMIGVKGVIDRFECLSHMQFTLPTVGAHPIIVVDAIRHVARLLNLGHETPRADGVHATRGQKEDVARTDLVTLEHFHDRPLFHTAAELVGVDRARKTTVKRGAGGGLDDVPHLRLAEGTITRMCQIVIRVHLHGEVVSGIDKLDQKWEARPKTFQNAAPDEIGAVSANQFAERDALLRPIGYDRRPTVYVRHFPAFANLARIGGQGLKMTDGRAAPKDFFQYRVE